ncbi:MAG: subclass B3 metallo-beta-lactamase [Proteobacteria bacterium]|nr:subclass B3 metallo-beta-lactamase [Pseudomonadota bacterium]
MAQSSKIAVLAALGLLGTAPAPAAPPTGASRNIRAACGAREGWSDPAPPAHIHGRSWYVGTCGITVVLIKTSAGLILIDSGPAEAAPQVLANVRALGFDPRRIRWILSTHEHFDHAGGIATLQRATGAKLATGPHAAGALRSGRPYPDDPQAERLQAYLMAPARVGRVLGDGGSLTLGDTTVTAHATPTHSPGSTSWTWTSCESGQCLTIAYADSLSTISSDGYRFRDHPERVAAARAGMRSVERLDCDILLTPHPSSSDLLERLSGQRPLAAPRQCVAYAAGASKDLAERLAAEQTGK